MQFNGFFSDTQFVRNSSRSKTVSKPKKTLFFAFGELAIPRRYTAFDKGIAV